MIIRQITHQFLKRLSESKLIIISGPRNVGKTTLVRELVTNFKPPIVWWQGDDETVNELLQGLTSTRIRQLVGSANTLIIDEAQRIDNINLCLRQINDTIKQLKIIVCCSTSIHNTNELENPLHGRKLDFRLLPFSFEEMVKQHGQIEENKQLNNRLVYGYYPEIVQISGDEPGRIRQLINQILYRDIMTAERIFKPEKLEKLLQAIAWQIGNEVSFHELGKHSGLDNQTVEKYVEIFEKAFLIFRLPSLSRNLVGEHKKSRKLYFYDNGLRNAIINQFNAVDNRNDTEALWENFLMSERLKHITYRANESTQYFWRTNSQQQVDYIEVRNEAVSAYMFRWDTDAKARFAKNFRETYKPTEMQIVTRANYFRFLGLE